MKVSLFPLVIKRHATQFRLTWIKCFLFAWQILAVTNLPTIFAQGVTVVAAAGSGRVALPDSIKEVSTDPADLAAAMEGAAKPALSRAALTSAETSVPLHFQIILKLRHFAELQSRVAAGITISRSEMVARYLPRTADYEEVSQWLAGQGFSVATAGASHAVVSATGSVALLQQIFQTDFGRVTFRGEEYTAAVSAPSLPAEIEQRVANLHGLQPYLHPHKSEAARNLSTAAVSSSIAPPYLVSDILNAYNISASGLTGAGQQIGIVIDTVPLDSDLTKFWTANGVSQSLNNIVTVNVSGKTLPSASGEETLDVSWSSGIAPGAQIVIYACGDLDNVNESYSRILDDLQDGSRPNLHQVSMSYGAGEETDETPADIKSVNQLFTAIAAYRVSLFASSGDEGAYDDGGRTVQVSYPASDPNVTGVGGTTLRLNASTGAVASETAWSPTTTSAQGPGGGAGSSGDAEDSSGGGASGYFARPSWQVGRTVPTGTMRLVPDVAFAADPDYGCYLVFDGEVAQYGGTSWGSPSWAGLCALVNQARAAAGETALGVANVSLYPLLGTTSFRDITSGNNGAYQAGAGYDLVTGLGVPDFSLLLSSLLGITAASAEVSPAITSALTESATTGSEFSYQISATNTPTTYAASGLPTGLSADATTGVVSGTLTTAGVYTITIGATNSGGTGEATLTITVVAATLPVVTLVATVPQATITGGEIGEATLSIPSALSSDLIVYYNLEGSATDGTDYKYLSGYAKIKAGKTSKIIKIVPEGDLSGEAKRVVKIELVANGAYTVGTAGFIKIKILNE